MLLLLSVCLLAQPQSCREERIPISYENANAFACLRHAQSTLARWQDEHPAWHVARWRCAVRDTLPKDL